MSWFRFYDEVVDDPKAQKLADKMFRTWVNLLCLACRNDGKLPERIEDVAFALRIRVAEAKTRLDILIAAGLFETVSGSLVPHNWNGRQYKSDSSTERVTKFRKRQCNVSLAVSETPPETEQIQSRAEAEADASDLPPLALATKVSEELSLERTPTMLEVVANAVTFCIKQEGKSPNAAVEFLIAKAKDELDNGGIPNRFWFSDRKWRKGEANGKARAARANRGFETIVE